MPLGSDVTMRLARAAASRRIAAPRLSLRAARRLPLPWFITTGETVTQNLVDPSALNQGSTAGNKFSPYTSTASAN